MRRLSQQQQQQSNSNSPANRTLHTQWFNSYLLSEDQQTDCGLQTDLLSGCSLTTDMAPKSINLLRVPYTKYLNEHKSGMFLFFSSNRGTTASRSQCPCGLRRKCAAHWSLESSFRIPLRAWMLVCCVCLCCVSIGLCDKLITRPEESYRVYRCVCVCLIYKPQQWGSLIPMWAVGPQITEITVKIMSF
jgi:hypothetical protein